MKLLHIDNGVLACIIGFIGGAIFGFWFITTLIPPNVFHRPDKSWVYWYTDDKIYRFRSVTNVCSTNLCSTNLYLLETAYQKDLEPYWGVLYYTE